MHTNLAFRQTPRTLRDRRGRGVSPERGIFAMPLLVLVLLLPIFWACDLISELPIAETPSEVAATPTPETLTNNWVKLDPVSFFPPVAFNSVIVSLTGGEAAGNGSTPDSSGFATPGGVAVQADGPVYVSDMTQGTIQSIDPADWPLQGTKAASGSKAANIEGDLITPSRLVVDGRGRLIIATLDRIELIQPSQPAIVIAGNGKAGSLAMAERR